MVAGRPRTTSLPKEDMVALGEEMVLWINKNPEVLHLSEWYTIEKNFIYNQWKQFITKEEFHPYYEKALKIVGKKYLDGTVNASIAQRWLRIYFKDLREQEDKDAQEKVDRENKSILDIPILSDIVDQQNENMLLKSQLAKALEEITQLKAK